MTLAKVSLPLRRPTLLVTFHPATLAPGEADLHTAELAAALEMGEDCYSALPAGGRRHGE